MHLFRSLALAGWVIAAASPLAAAEVEPASDDASATTKLAVEKSEIIRCDSDQQEPEINARPPFCRRDFERLPVASSPWSVLEQTAGVLLDRVNVGGIEDGTQPFSVLVGSAPENTVWLFEGLNLTDLTTRGSSSTFYDVGALESLVVATGGPDAALATAGPTIDLTQGRGGASWRGSARVLVAEGDWQDGGERLEAVSEAGAEVGGPVIADRLFAWAAFGREEIERLSLDGLEEDIELQMTSVKLNANLTGSTSLVLFGNRSEKETSGRGAGITRPPVTSWKQSGPVDITKLELNQQIGERFFIHLLAGQVEGGFDLDPEGGDAVNAVRGPDAVWRHSFQLFSTDRDSDEIKADGGTFWGDAWSHELRFGAGYREAEVRSTSSWPGDGLIGLADVRFGTRLYLGLASTDAVRGEEVKTSSLYLDETLVHGPLSARLGLRYDRQEGNNLPSTVAPAPLHPALLPGGTFAGRDGGFEWSNISPRLGLRYTIGQEQRTTLAASFSRYADQLGSAITRQVNPMRAGYLYFLWNDRNNDLRLTSDELGSPFALLPNFAANGQPFPDPDQIDPDLEAPTTDELTLGAEQRFGANVVLGLTGTWRRSTDLLERELLVREGVTGTVRTHRRSDYERLQFPAGQPLPDGSQGRLELYALRRGILPTGGVRIENGDREQEAQVLTLWGQLRGTSRLRLSGHLSWHDWEGKVPEAEDEDPTLLVPGDYEDGGAVLVPSAANEDRRDVFVHAGWSYSLTASYEVAAERPWGFAVAAHLHGREGYPLAYSRRFTIFDGLGTRRVLVTPENDAIRLDDLHLLDLRIAKSVQLGPVSAELGLDIFNALGTDTVLQRETLLNSPRAGVERETVEPRTLRLGVRLAFD